MEVRGGLYFEHHWKESKCQDNCHLSYLLHGHPPWSYVHWEGRGPGFARAVPLASGRRREALSRVGPKLTARCGCGFSYLPPVIFFSPCLRTLPSLFGRGRWGDI